MKKKTPTANCRKAQTQDISRMLKLFNGRTVISDEFKKIIQNELHKNTLKDVREIQLVTNDCLDYFLLNDEQYFLIGIYDDRAFVYNKTRNKYYEGLAKYIAYCYGYRQRDLKSGEFLQKESILQFYLPNIKPIVRVPNTKPFGIHVDNIKSFLYPIYENKSVSDIKNALVKIREYLAVNDAINGFQTITIFCTGRIYPILELKWAYINIEHDCKSEMTIKIIANAPLKGMESDCEQITTNQFF